MSDLRRIVRFRHGEADGASSIRYHGSSDVGFAPAGREQLRGAALDPESPDPGEIVELPRNPDGTWDRGRHASDPVPLAALR